MFTRSARATLLLIILAGSAAHADVVVITATRDNTICSEAVGNSNGASDGLYAGNTRGGNTRRGLVYFDLTGQVPPGATISNVAMTVNLVQGQGVQTVSIHTCLKPWGEGTSAGPGGTGSAADPGEPTWSSNKFGASLWTSAGGDFSPSLASAMIDSSSFVDYSWSSPGMLADVNAWLATPGSNFGWMLIGNESANQTAMKFISRESGADFPARLTITYTTGNGGCQPADIADDTGNPLPSAGSNTGVNEGDYNAFFAGFFDALAYCDQWDDAGNPLPTAGVNSGVNEGDYNGFFATFFNGCP